MAVKTDAQLTTAANVIKNETNTDANTAERVGDMLLDIIDSKINTATINTAKVSVSSAEILALNATPKTIIPAPGAGKMILVDKILIAYDYGTAAYTTNINLSLTGGGLQDYTMTSALGQSNDYSLMYIVNGNSGTSTLLSALANTACTLTVPGGNPLAGDGSLTIYVTYVIVTL